MSAGLAEALRRVGAIRGARQTISGRVAGRALHRAGVANLVERHEVAGGAGLAVYCERLVRTVGMESHDSSVLFGVQHGGRHGLRRTLRAVSAGVAGEAEASRSAYVGDEPGGRAGSNAAPCFRDELG